MEFKVVISDQKTGKSYQKEIKDEKAKRLDGLVVGSEIDGSMVGLDGYKLKITGGSDKSGFPMKKGVHGTGRAKVMMAGGIGYNPGTAVRKRKTVRAEKIAKDIVQINTLVTKEGGKKLEEIFAPQAEEKPVEGQKTA
ncbi:MAG: 30S ribosomal protein S6e [Candidatus Altiarchaeales archaeon IMC4]|nr:MAG: 30S ribosomal protein S6e [Candidatus Altiarchaeales archaeon IMC4]